GAVAVPVSGRRPQCRRGGRLSGPAVGNRCLPDPDRPHRVARRGHCRRANGAVASLLVSSGIRRLPVPPPPPPESGSVAGTPGVLTTALFATAMWDRLGAARDRTRRPSGRGASS